MPFKILEHTADIGVIAEGKDFPSALEEAARGMFSLMGKARQKEILQFSMERERRDELVVFLFSEILARCEVEGFTPAKMKVLDFDGKSVKCEVRGEYKTLKNIIKAVTFHMLEVKEGKGGCSIQVLFDI